MVFWTKAEKVTVPLDLVKESLKHVTFIGGIAVLHKGEHLAIDLVSEHVSPKVKNAFQVLYILVYLFVSGYLTYYGTQLCLNPMIYLQKTQAMQLPRVTFYAIMPVCMGVQFVYCWFDLFFTVRRLFLRKGAQTVEKLEE